METGYIYVLKSNQSELIYVGSTRKTIQERFMRHKRHYREYLNNNMNYISSFELIKYDDCYIELIKEIYCSKKQLMELENEEINKTKNCVNIVQAIRSIEQKKLYHIKYDQQEHIKQYQKQYIKTHKYYENHKEEMKIYNKQYYENHKEEIKVSHLKEKRLKSTSLI